MATAYLVYPALHLVAQPSSLQLIHLPLPLLPLRHPLHPSSTTPPLQRQPRKMPSHHGPCEEVRIREPPVPLRDVQIRERTIRRRLVDPPRHARHNLRAHLVRRHGRGVHLPVGLGVEVPAIEGEAVFLQGEGVPFGLGGVDCVGDEVSGLEGGGLKGGLAGGGAEG